MADGRVGKEARGHSHSPIPLQQPPGEAAAGVATAPDTSSPATAPGGQDPNTVIGVDPQGLTSSEQMLRKYLMDRTERKMRVDETPSLESNPRARIKQSGRSAGGGRLRAERSALFGVLLAPAQRPFSLQPPSPYHPCAGQGRGCLGRLGGGGLGRGAELWDSGQEGSAG